MSRFQDIVITALRWILGSVFISSGAFKCVDPVGTAIYVEKYLATYSLSGLTVASEAIAVALIVVEFAVGLLLILGVCRRGVAFLSSVMLLIFTIITLLGATVLPIGDCGCFGDAVKLTPWETFFKNVILLPISIYLWRTNYRGDDRITIVDFVSVAIALILPLGVSLYTLSTMPLVDFLPYKVGVNLRERVAMERRLIEESTRTVLRFRDVATNSIVDFDAMATECWANENLEFVESVSIVEDVAGVEYADFVLYNSDGEDVTDEVLNREGRIALLCINDIKALDDSAKRAIEHLYSLYPASAVYVVSATQVDAKLPSTHLLVDAMTLRSMIRADIGVMILHDGVVEHKDDI